MHLKKKIDYIDIIANTFLILFSIAILYPMVNVIAVSLSGSGPIVRDEVTIFPIDFTLESYTYFLEYPRFIQGFFNQVQYTIEGVAANLFFTALMAYPLSKTKLLGRATIMKLIIFTMYFQGGIIPLYMLVASMGLMNTEWSWILANLITTTNMVIMINGYRAVPESLYEAAYLDGATEWQVFFKIALPLSKATIASIGLFYFLNHWNSWYPAMLYLNDIEKFPLQLFMRSIMIEESSSNQPPEMTQNLTPDGVKNALIVLSMIPVMVVYPLVQRYFVTGVMMGSVKG